MAAEVQRVRASETTLALLAEGFWQVPRKVLSLEELERQIGEWPAT